LLDRPLAARAQFFVARPFIHDHRVGKRDPGDVRRFDDDVDVTLSRNHGVAKVFGAEVVAGDE
jgi:hypothetical protein